MVYVLIDLYRVLNHLGVVQLIHDEIVGVCVLVFHTQFREAYVFHTLRAFGRLDLKLIRVLEERATKTVVLLHQRTQFLEFVSRLNVEYVFFS